MKWEFPTDWLNAMSFIPAADVFKVAVQYVAGDAKRAVNVFHCKHGAGDFATQAFALSGTISTWFDAAMKSYITSYWKLDQIEVRDVSVEAGGVIIESGLDIAGTHAGAIDALGTAMTVTWQTGLAGKSYRGRTYVTGLSYDARSSVVWNDTITANVLTAYGLLAESLEAVSFPLQVVSYYHENTPRVAAVVTPISNLRANVNVYRQWRRMTSP